MRPLFAIAPLALLLAFFSPSTAELGASLASFKQFFLADKPATASNGPSAHLPSQAATPH